MRVHTRQRPPCKADFVWLQAVAAADQPLHLLLNCWVGGVGLEGTLHMPDRRVEVAFILANDGHAHMRYKVIWDGRQHSLKNVSCVAVPLCF